MYIAPTIIINIISAYYTVFQWFSSFSLFSFMSQRESARRIKVQEHAHGVCVCAERIDYSNPFGWRKMMMMMMMMMRRTRETFVKEEIEENSYT